jgi:MoxR-like ATPase
VSAIEDPREEAGKLFFITAASAQAREHLDASLRRGVPLDVLEPLASSVFAVLTKHSHDDRVFAWGARPGAAAEAKWERLRAGDIALVYANGRFPLWGKVIAKARDRQVAWEIWGEDSVGQTWDCMFFLDPVHPLDLSREDFVAVLGYSENYFPQGFEIPGRDAQERVREGYGSAEAFVRAIEVGMELEDPPARGSRWVDAVRNVPVTGASAPPPAGSDLRPLHDRITSTEVDQEVEARGLVLDDGVVPQVVAALNSGKHVILTGPPGTAKTTLALAVAAAAERVRASRGHVITTATSDWTTFETIGGLRPTEDGTLAFRAGQFVRAIGEEKWLVVDELNRSNFDRAFGQLFTVLSGQPVELPWTRDGWPLALVPHESRDEVQDVDAIVVPPSWRMIATMNVFDKTLLFEMSYALMRRFAFVEVPSPSAETYIGLIRRAARDTPDAAELTATLLPVRDVKDIGPASFMDIARYLRERMLAASAPDRAPGRFLFEAFYSFLLPQFEGIDDETARRLYAVLAGVLRPEDLVRLRAHMRTILGVELPETASAIDDDEA